MRSVDRDVLDDYLRSQDGVITLAQARRAGLSQDAINRRLRSGHWQRCSRGVYFAADRHFTDSARLRAAVLAYGPRACGSGLAAAWWHGLSKFAPEIVEVTVARKSRLHHQPGTRLRRRDLSPRDVVERAGLRVTAMPLTVVEAAVRRGGGPKLMDAALQGYGTCHVELAQLWRAHLRNKGRHGSPAARRLLRAAQDGARSEAERLLVRLLRDAKLTGWKPNHPVGGYKVDVAFVGEKVAIEVDGWAFHTDSEVFQTDRNRQNVIALLGWKVLRFTWLDLTAHPKRVVTEIAAATGQKPSSEYAS